MVRKTDVAETHQEYFVDLNGLAKMLKFHRNTISRWVKEGLGPPFVEINGARRWLIEDVKKWAQDSAKTLTEDSD